MAVRASKAFAVAATTWMMWGLLPAPVTAMTMVKRNLADSNAVCLDGSAAAYYVQKPESLEQAKELIQNGILVDWPGDSMCISYSPLQGHAGDNGFDPAKTLGSGEGRARKHGLLTYEEQAYAACAMRVVQSEGNPFAQGSSKNWAGVLESIKPDRKRLVEDGKFLYVAVNSCDGTAFAGNAGEVAVPERLQIAHKAGKDGPMVTVKKLHFQGRKIMESIMQDLAALFLSEHFGGDSGEHAMMLRNASLELRGAPIKFVMHGASSGGMGLWWLADKMAAHLGKFASKRVPRGNKAFEVMAVSNGGLFLDMPSLHPSATPGASEHVFADQLKGLFSVSIENFGNSPSGLIHAARLFPKELLAHGRAPKLPFFVVQSKFEESQVADALFARCDLTVGLKPEQRASLGKFMTPAQVQQVENVLRPLSKHSKYYKGTACTFPEVTAIQNLWADHYSPLFEVDSPHSRHFFSTSNKNSFFLTSCVAHVLLGLEKKSWAGRSAGANGDYGLESVEDAIVEWVKNLAQAGPPSRMIDQKPVDVFAGKHAAVYCDYHGNKSYAEDGAQAEVVHPAVCPIETAHGEHQGQETNCGRANGAASDETSLWTRFLWLWILLIVLAALLAIFLAVICCCCCARR